MRVEESDVVEDDEVGDETESIELVSTDNVGDPSVEINVQELISELEEEGVIETAECAHAARRRLEELMERKRSEQDLEDFDDYEV